MRVLVTFGSARGGTEGLAQTVAEGLRDEGFSVDLVPAGQVHGLDGYDAVVVGGALYAGRWHKAARRFVKRHTTELTQRPVYFFSSGPLDGSATQREIPPVRGVKALDATGRCPRSHDLWGSAFARCEGVPGPCHGEEAGRRLAGHRARAGLGWVRGRAASC
jgi:Flavodoxin domain